MSKYLYTSDLRISDLSNRVAWAAQTELSGEQITDKSELNNVATLRFYFNLYEGTQICIDASQNPLIAIRNYIQKFQFPNTRTQESFNDSLSEKMLFAPYRVIVTLLHEMAQKDLKGESFLTQYEILYFLFCNPLVYQNPTVNYSQLIKQIESSREKNISYKDFVSKHLQWNQHERQSREMINVLVHASKCFKLKSGFLSFSTANLSLSDEKDFIDSVLNHKYMWVPSDPTNFKLSQIEYTNYMDTANIPYNVVELPQQKNVSSLPPLDQPHQQIFYGAPGTGKSHTINRETKGRKTFRTTFHPDSDYSTFVGAYKPTIVSEIRYGLNGSTAVPYRVGGKDLMENRIEYRFVKQAFMKAYIASWREFADANGSPSTPQAQGSSMLSYNHKNSTWILTDVDDTQAYLKKEETLDVDGFRDRVKKCWNKGIDYNNSEHHQAVVCQWCKDNREAETADECWEAILAHLQEGNAIARTLDRGTKCYTISYKDGEILVESEAKVQKEAVSKQYGKNEAATSSQKAIAKLLEGIDKSNFDDAWEKLKAQVGDKDSLQRTAITVEDSTIAPVFLIIEEINRGNCAQIFGDLFQLLDRKEGFSQYPIHADEDVRKCLRSEHSDEDPSFGIDGLEFSPEQASYINSLLDCEDDVAEKIARGEVLVLPPNLYIWATMNTSDQSLFPIDSAFKRRWEWKYVKITDAKKNWRIEGNGYSCDWWKFVQEMNKKIASATRSDDKKLGYFFCKPEQDNTFIDENKFVGKVIFYLWNDVFKDNDYSIFKVNASNGEPTFDDFYMEGEDGKIVPDSSSVKQFLINVVGQENMTIDGNAPQDQEQEQQSSTLSIEE